MAMRENRTCPLRMAGPSSGSEGAQRALITFPASTSGVDRIYVNNSIPGTHRHEVRATGGEGDKR